MYGGPWLGTSDDQRTLARMAKIRLYSHEDGGPAYSVHWHWQGWDDSDGTVLDQSGGSYTGDADEVCAKVMTLMVEVHRHMLRGIDPFPDPAGPLDLAQGLDLVAQHHGVSNGVTPHT